MRNTLEYMGAYSLVSEAPRKTKPSTIRFELSATYPSGRDDGRPRNDMYISSMVLESRLRSWYKPPWKIHVPGFSHMMRMLGLITAMGNPPPTGTIESGGKVPTV